LRSGVEHQIASGYQLEALLRGWAPQRAWHRARLELVGHVLPPDDGSLVLDAAAGAGIVTWKFGRPDIVSTDMRVGACRFVRTHSAGARAVAADLRLLPFRPATFSRIYFLEALEHLSKDDGQRALRELRRVAATGGKCLITTPNYRSAWILLEHLLDLARLTPPMADGQHVSQYDGARLAEAVEAAGWRVTRAGSFNLIAPLLGLVSRRAGAWGTRQEAKHARRAGTLLYCVCEATSQGA
jgi:SAM-dependent methyltransferase